MRATRCKSIRGVIVATAVGSLVAASCGAPERRSAPVSGSIWLLATESSVTEDVAAAESEEAGESSEDINSALAPEPESVAGSEDDLGVASALVAVAVADTDDDNPAAGITFAPDANGESAVGEHVVDVDDEAGAGNSAGEPLGEEPTEGAVDGEDDVDEGPEDNSSGYEDSASGEDGDAAESKPRPKPIPLVVTGTETAMYLTFDDGPHPVHTPELLDVLGRYGARATFFVLGKLVHAYPELIERIVAEGHTVANHTWNHESLADVSREEFDDTVGRTQAALGEHATACLRPPYNAFGTYTQEWAADHGLRVATWNVDPQDWRPKPAEELADHIVEHARPGAVVVLHDGGGDRTRTVEAVDMALERLADTGLTFEPMC